ncbi:ankyrin [Xylaria bambusicola]|uniref:ankyrin n=1 Tax=Xylaria bambusicola TaxID=326684 RepID=UPI00200727CB|nr:ankyrin [Xylaria bambusicola]KAI0521189.1 ankyrin [Xylaria bambusicola]
MGESDSGHLLDPQSPANRSRSHSRSPSGHRRSPNLVTWSAGDVFHKATNLGDVDTVAKTLRASPGCVDAREPRGRTALHEAALYGHTAVAKALLEHGADVNARSFTGYTPLTFAAENGHTETMLALIERRADLNAASTIHQMNLRGHTPLHRAAFRENLEAVQLLAGKGASINAVTATGMTAQQVAIQKGPLAIVLVLTAAAEESRTQDANGHDAIQYAQMLDEPRRGQVMEILGKWGDKSRYKSDLLRCQRSGELSRFFDMRGNLDLVAMLCWSAAKGRRAVTEYVLDLSRWGRLDLANAKDQSGWTALHHAAWGGEPNIAQKLLETGAVVDSLTKNNRWTPLLLAAERGRRRTVQVLLSHSADVLATTHHGMTALDLASKGKHEKTLEVLLNEIQALKSTKMKQDTRRWRLAMLEFQKAEAISNKKDEELSEIAEEIANTMPPAGAKPNNSLFSGAFDGTMFSASPTSPDLVQSRTYHQLINTWDEFFEFHEKDRRVKIAILDTGFDSKHRDWDNPRALRFKNNQPESDPRDVKQRDRIKEFRDFCGSVDGQESDGVDVDGHGTQVTGIILRLAPRADVYVARICEGDRNRGLPAHLQTVGLSTNGTKPQPAAVAAAIDWAIEKNVDIINMSFGFSRPPVIVKRALERAKGKILVFAAMSNDGNNSPTGAAWPARDLDYAIGIHSCKEGGRKTSDFTPPHVPATHNLMVVGEGIITHWPEAKGGGFRLDDGTSFSTPVAAAMAALVLAFWYQRRGRNERMEVENLVDLEDLRRNKVMSSLMMQNMGTKGENVNFSYIRPQLLWMNYNPLSEDQLQPEYKRRHAWNVIQDALSRL